MVIKQGVGRRGARWKRRLGEAPAARVEALPDATSAVEAPESARFASHLIGEHEVGVAQRQPACSGEVVLRWEANEDGVCFSVRDSGIGIEAQHIPRLTERFYRVDRSRSRETGGTGLGLSIVKHVLTRHHGRLEITSEMGKGSTFSACFPASRIVTQAVVEA